MHYYDLYLHRIVKQTLKESGSNATKSHMENVSLSALFLLEACKLADSIFGVTHSSHHTIADATTDINKMVDHLRKSSVSTEKKDSHSPLVNHCQEVWTE